MSTDIKPGQVWAATADPEQTQRVIEVRDGHVWSENRHGGHVVLSAAFFPNGRHLVKDVDAPEPEKVASLVKATPAPLDPSKVKAGDTVTLEADGGRRVTAPVSEQTLPGKTKGTWFLDVYYDDQPASFSSVHWTLTDHQPAPEPEPEWKPGTVGMATLNHLVSDNSSFGMRVMRVEWDGLNGFATETGRIVEDGSTTYSISDFVPLVVIDPAAVDVNALAKVIRDAVNMNPTIWKHSALQALTHLGIEAP